MQNRNLKFIVFLLALFLMVSGVMTNNSFAKDKEGGYLYTAYNIWYESGKETSLWCINYKKGNMIPAGTAVKDVRITAAVTGRVVGGESRAIRFVTVEDGQEYYVNFNVKFHPGKTIKDYKQMMFTEKSLDELVEGFSAIEIEAISEGKLKTGMSREAVLVSYGYPPEHRTPELGDNVWIYWMNRFRSKAIHFNDEGLTFKPKQDPNEL